MAADPYRALVIEDDPDLAHLMGMILENGSAMVADLACDAGTALDLLERVSFDVIVSDIELPGRSGLELLDDFKRLAPGVPVIFLTAHASLDYAVVALRGGASEFLTKPIQAAKLVEVATGLARSGRRKRDAAPRPLVVLAVGAHPDDVEIGAGGALAAHHAAGDAIVILTLSGGAVGGQSGERRAESQAAAAIVGARLVHHDFPDTKIDPASGVITAIEEVIREIRPDQVYTHSANDRHQDHRAVNAAVQIAARSVQNVACFQSPSCTVEFRPDRFVDIGDQLETKLRMLAAFASQSGRDYMQTDLVRATARYWSRFGVGEFAEPLETLRASATPQSRRASPESGGVNGDQPEDSPVVQAPAPVTAEPAHDTGKLLDV